MRTWGKIRLDRETSAPCHMGSNEKPLDELREVETPIDVTLGYGRSLKAIVEGTVRIELLLPNGSTQKCRLDNALAYSRTVVQSSKCAKTSEIRNTVKFTKTGCEIYNKKNKMLAFGTKAGNLYYLEHCRENQNLSIVEESK